MLNNLLTMPAPYLKIKNLNASAPTPGRTEFYKVTKETKPDGSKCIIASHATRDYITGQHFTTNLHEYEDGPGFLLLDSVD